MEDAKYAASGPAHAVPQRRETPLSELIDRLNEVRQRIIDTTAAARGQADAIVGEGIEKPHSTERPVRANPIHSGQLGNAFSALSNVEEVVGLLEDQVRRLNYIA